MRVPHDVEAELAVAADRSMPELAEYEVELREGIYRGHRRATQQG